MVQVVGPKRGQLEGEHGAVGGSGFACTNDIKKKKKANKNVNRDNASLCHFPPPCPAPSFRPPGRAWTACVLTATLALSSSFCQPHPIPPASLPGLSFLLQGPVSLSPHPPTMVAKLMTSSRLPGTTLPGCSLRRALVSAAWGRGRLILGRPVRCRPARICCLASSRTRARSPGGARDGPPQDGHADLAFCIHANAHSSTGQSWTSESPMLQVDGPESRASGGNLMSPRGCSGSSGDKQCHSHSLQKGRATCPRWPGPQQAERRSSDG